jgi:hypothetical protein
MLLLIIFKKNFQSTLIGSSGDVVANASRRIFQDRFSVGDFCRIPTKDGKGFEEGFVTAMWQKEGGSICQVKVLIRWLFFFFKLS